MEGVEGMDERYPIGGYETPTAPDQKQFIQWVETIESFPARLQKRLDGLDAGDLDAQYREGGWNIRQVIHHIADAMMNSYLHFKLATTEENPQIKPYEEVLWCEQEDEKRLVPRSFGGAAGCPGEAMELFVAFARWFRS